MAIYLCQDRDAEQGPELPAPQAALGMPPSRSGDMPYVLLEQRDFCILWKPPGWTVSVGDFADDEDLEWRSGARGRPLQRWVAEKLGQYWPIARDEKAEFGLVHRLDRDTSGPILCAKTYRGFHGLQLCIVRFQVRKDYVCLCEGFLPGPRDSPRVLDMKLIVEGSGPQLRSTIGSRGQRALLEILGTSHLRGPDGTPISLVKIRLRTGRMHQIRAQLSSLGHPLLGDVLYGSSESRAWLPRIFLHSSSLGVKLHGEALQADCPLPHDLQDALECCIPIDDASRASCQSWLNGIKKDDPFDVPGMPLYTWQN